MEAPGEWGARAEPRTGGGAQLKAGLLREAARSGQQESDLGWEGDGVGRGRTAKNTGRCGGMAGWAITVQLGLVGWTQMYLKSEIRSLDAGEGLRAQGGVKAGMVEPG